MSYRRTAGLTAVLATVLTCFALQGAAEEKKVPDYSMKSRAEVPVEYTWRIEDLYPTMDAWKADRAVVRGLMGQLDARAKDWTTTPQRFRELYQLADSVNLIGGRLYAYAAHQSNVDLSNTTFRGMQGELQTMFAEFGARMAFRNDDILKTDEKKLRSFFANDPAMAKYRFRVDEVLRARDHVLPKDQQSIVAMTGLFSGSTQEAADVLNNVELPPATITMSDGKQVVLNTANYMRNRGSANAADRSLVMHTFWENHKKFENTLASMLDGGIKSHLFAARTAHYASCLDARLFDDNIDTTVYTQLIATVRSNLGPLHRLLRLRQRLLGLDTLKYDDIYASAVKSVDKQYSYDEAVEIVKKCTAPLGTDYAAGLRHAFTDRWVDRYTNKGKQLGAYSGGVYGVHPYVKMNFNGHYDDVSTLAHELGHSMHSYFSNGTQDFGNASYPTFLAEIASTFNENLLIEYMLKNETDDLVKLSILDAYLDQVRGTIYRQTLFAEFELAMHRRVEDGQTLTADWLTEQYLALTRAYYGHDAGVMRVDEYIGNEWSYVPHFYLNYYVFQYSTGMIASLALSDKVLHGGKADLDRYLTMLKSGGSDSPLVLLRNAGVDMTSAAPGQAALKRFDTLVGEMETIVGRLKAAGRL
jgi:oligoendopeptidase F